jgi:ketosteroid isomerase-like protein
MALQGVSVVEELSRRFLAGDGAGAMALFAPDITIEQPSSLPHGGTHRGHAGVGAMGKLFGEHWSRTVSAPDIRGWGEQVIQVTSQTWTSVATGRSATVDVVELMTVADGLVRSIRVFPRDTASLLALVQP